MLFYVIIISIFLGLYVYYTKQKGSRMPPGMKAVPIETGLPIIGILNDIKGPLGDYLIKLGKKRGEIYFVKFGMRDILVLNNFGCMKAALVDNGEAFSGRWQLNKYLFNTKGSGIIWTESDLWIEQRAFILKTLKEFGFGRSRSIEIVQDECFRLLKDLEPLNSKTTDFSSFISLYTANVISKFIMNRTFNHENRDLKLIVETMKILADKKDLFVSLCLMLPVLDRNKWLTKFLIWITSRHSVLNLTHRIFEREMKERLETLDFTAVGEDFMDRFLTRQHQLRKKNGSEGFFTEQQLLISSFDIILAGYDTTSSTLTWSFMFMAMHPDVQKKVHEEISDQIGTERLPTMSDKPSLVYTQAVMDEIMRSGTVAPLSLMHRTLKDTCVNGYFIPKDTLVIPNIFACHLDPVIWEKPLEFYPGHFLSTDQNGSIKYRPRTELIPFGMGKRQCLGESLARTEYFIFFTAVLQKFDVSLPDEIRGKVSFDVFQASDGVIRNPHFKSFVFKKRN